jgi:hypothetical protein
MVAAPVFVAVGDDGLVLHAQMRGLDHAVFLTAERIGPEHALVEVQVLEDLREQLLAGSLVLRQHPVGGRHLVTRHAGVGARDRLIRRDVERDVVIADGVVRVPVVGAGTVALRHDLDEAAVGGDDEQLWHPDAQGEGVGLVGGVILARPPEVAALALASRGDPGLAGLGLGPHETAVPRGADRLARNARIIDRGL